MASIQEQLNRTDWDPMPGEQIVGTIAAINVRQGKSGPYPVLVVQLDNGNGELNVSCALMAGEVIAAQPKLGERVGVKFHGPQDRANGDGTWDKYAIAFDRPQPAELDWAAMAAARNQQNGQR